jgi:hypothetical protein
MSYSACSDSGATSAYQSPVAPPAASKIDHGDAFSWMRELYLQLTR